MATEREGRPHREVLGDELVVGVRRDELREGDVQVVQIRVVEVGAERDPAGLLDDVVECLVEIGTELSRYGLVGAREAAAAERHPELLTGGAKHGGQGVALDLAGNVELGGFVEPRAAHLVTAVGATELLVPGAPAEPVARLQHEHRVSVVGQVSGGGQAGDTPANDDDVMHEAGLPAGP